MHRSSLAARLARTVLLGVTLAAILASLTAAPTLAAKPTKGSGGGGSTTGSGSGSLALVMVRDQNGNGAPNYGDAITWNVSTTATAYPYVGLICSQNGATVLNISAGYYDTYSWSKDMYLSSGMWSAGAASCTATLSYSDGRRAYTLATYSFSAGA